MGREPQHQGAVGRAMREKVVNLIDEAALHRVPGGKQKNVIAARGLEAEREPFFCRSGLDEGAAGFVGDGPKAALRRSDQHSVGHEALHA